MKVTLSLSQQQQQLLLAVLAERSHPVPALDRLIADAFDEYCVDHPEQSGNDPGDG